MTQFDRYFHAPFASARAYLFGRLFLILVAFDTWTLMIGHAGRYGVDGFNVAHFRWLDAITPLPSAGLYIGVLLATGLLAAAVAVGGAGPLTLFILFLLYTFSWAMSMLDSYQHHYFVSSVLLCLVFFPVLRATDIHAALTPNPAPVPEPRKTKPKKKQKATPTAATPPTAHRATTLYTAAGWLLILVFILIPPERRVVGFILCGLLLAVATRFYARSQLRDPARASGFGFNLLGATTGILYTYTAIAKLDAPWRDGFTITRISAANRVFAPWVQTAGEFGIPQNEFWSLVATSVIPVEFTIAATYFVAVRADASDSRWPARIAFAGWLLAMSLHLGAEAMNLEIGWFSYYMIVFACGFLLPARSVDALATLLTAPARWIATQLADLLAPQDRARAFPITLGIAAAVALMLAAVGYQLDLPGAIAACLIAALLTAAVAVAAAVRGRAIEIRPLLLGTGFAAAAMWFSIAQSESRWDFYRFLGGDLRRRGEPEAALQAYERGERYAPKGQSRQQAIDELRKELGR